MKLEKENKKELFHLYWIIQGIILIFGIKGIGNLPLIGGSYLITITILNVFFNNKFLKTIIISMYLIYSCIYILASIYIMMMIDFNIIPLAILIIGSFNFIYIFIMKDLEP